MGQFRQNFVCCIHAIILVVSLQIIFSWEHKAIICEIGI